jgi:alcohol dehydrogenase class IV
VLAFNRPAIEARIERLAAYVGLAPSFDAFARWVLEIREATGVPHTLGGLKVDGAKADLIAEMAINDPTAGSNPVTLTKQAAREIFDRALAGG